MGEAVPKTEVLEQPQGKKSEKTGGNYVLRRIFAAGERAYGINAAWRTPRRLIPRVGGSGKAFLPVWGGGKNLWSAGGAENGRAV
jgi:hypothetical protein